MARHAQEQGNYQVQTQTQQLTPQQVLVVRLTELPLNDLRERIDKELEDNPWLQGEQQESGGQTAEMETDGSDTSSAEPDDVPPEQNSDSYDDEDDGIPREPQNGSEEKVHGERADDSESFYDYLTAQLCEYDLTDREKEIATYLVGSLGDDGLLRVPLQQIADELDIYQNIQTSDLELEHLLTTVVQQMEPPGIGGRNLQECLVLQARRNYTGETRDRLVRLFQGYWDDFSHLRWAKIQQSMRLDSATVEELKQRIQRLTPRPGGSVGGDHSDNPPITPDFFVETDENGEIHLSLNEGDLPRLKISDDVEEELQMPAVSQAERDALRYVRNQVFSARMFIDAIAQRRETMLKTMKAIIRLQRPFFLEGDEMMLNPMRLEDVAQLTGLDRSTISRVSNSKYVQTDHGLYPLRWFFSAAAKQNGDDVTVRKMLSELEKLVKNEDKRHPLTDERLVKLLKQSGYAVARRTVAKYRTQLGIPESRLRRA